MRNLYFFKSVAFLFSLIFFISISHSCLNEKDDINNDKKIAVNNFENAIKLKGSEIKSFVKDIHSSPFEKSISKRDETLNNLILKEEEEEAKRILLPLLKDSKKLLLEYGIDDILLTEVIGDNDSPEVIELALLFSRAEHINSRKVTYTCSFNIIPMSYINLSGDSESDWYDCLLRAAGIDAVLEIVNGGLMNSAVSKALLKKAIRKAATRTLGWVGAGIAVYEFGDCMDYW